MGNIYTKIKKGARTTRRPLGQLAVCQDMNIEEITTSIKSKLDEETYAKISDDIANLSIFDNSNTTILQEKNNEISKLKDDKEQLIKANGNLMLKIPRTNVDDNFEESKTRDSKPFDFRCVFDEKGNFKSQM